MYLFIYNQHILFFTNLFDSPGVPHCFSWSGFDVSPGMVDPVLATHFCLELFLTNIAEIMRVLFSICLYIKAHCK